MPNNKQKKGKGPKRPAAARAHAHPHPRPKMGKNAKKKVARKSAGGGRELVLSSCATEYAQCLLNPCAAPPACMPSIGGCHSRKVKVFVRGTFACSTVAGPNQGMGFISCFPGVGISNSQNWVLASDTPWPGTTIPGSTGTGILGFSSNSDYADASFGAGLATVRLVSLCIRIRYIGTELNRGGAVFGLLEPDHLSLTGKNISQLRAYPACTESPVGMGWTEIVYTGPVNPSEFEYTNTVITTPGYVPNSNNIMAFFVRCPPTVASQFDFEVWGNYEVIGPNVQGKTPSFSDPAGLSVVTAGAMTAAATGQNGHHGGNGFLSKAIHGIGKAAEAAFSHIGKAGPISVGGLVKSLLPKLAARALPAVAGMLL